MNLREKYGNVSKTIKSDSILLLSFYSHEYGPSISLKDQVWASVPLSKVLLNEVALQIFNPDFLTVPAQGIRRGTRHLPKTSKMVIMLCNQRLTTFVHVCMFPIPTKGWGFHCPAATIIFILETQPFTTWKPSTICNIRINISRFLLLLLLLKKVI